MARTKRKRHQPKAKIAAKYGVGVSWVLAVIAGRELGIDVPSYLDIKQKSK